MVEQWNRDRGTLEDLMVKQCNSRTIMLEQRWENGKSGTWKSGTEMVEQCNI